ncbi:hypothetical protein EVAR_68892_1 [Eumeta japonica]|uniref:Uncharacterized protein n=1 Tax=Eumeta variegata TaxID=151549 RepID=A0A4C1ZXX3_EUMVA|nr:hypothetical protein EVAR_68892_1 [Eumeta japonica]
MDTRNSEVLPMGRHASLGSKIGIGYAMEGDRWRGTWSVLFSRVMRLQERGPSPSSPLGSCREAWNAIPTRWFRAGGVVNDNLLQCGNKNP